VDGMQVGTPTAEEIVADEATAAAIEWFTEHARNVRSEVFKKLADPTTGNPGDSGWLIGRRSELNKAMLKTATNSKFLEEQARKGDT